ncbi:MAG: hypothetical protein KGL04_07660, partial [Elusimicrobia bacterium]|nr:hypothetical protein [Elusimicrobiota bacterium]
LGQYRGIGVVPFKDPRGQGMAIAEGVESGLEKMMFSPVEPKALQEIISSYKTDSRDGLGFEALEMIHEKTSADAIIMGRMTPDWSAAIIVMIETGMGDQVMRAAVRPPGKQKVFSNPDEVSKAVLKTLAGLR